MPSCPPAPSWVAAAALPLVLAAGACAPAAQGPPAAASPPPELARFYDQELRFGSCDGYATTAADEAIFTSRPDLECARLECAERSGGERVLASVGTRDTVRDMDVLRAALGRERLDFLGQSYGTRMGALYAEAFPQNVRTMVLDGAVDPRAGNERRLAQYAGFQQSFDRMAADCATSPECPLGTDPARATERFQQIVRPLLDRPVPYGDGRRFTYTDAVNAVVAALYSPASWPAIPRGLTELQDGDPGRLVRLIELFSGREPDGPGTNTTSADLAITCMDDEQRMAPEQAADFRARIYEMAPFADPGRGPDGALDACTAWPGEPKTTYPLPERIEGLAPTLTISLTRDLTTPYDGAVRMAEMLGGSLLTVDGDGHTIAATGANPCVNQVVADYLRTGRPPSGDARCAT